MSAWPKNPIVYQVNTWVWLHDLSQQYGQPVTLATVPDAEWDALAAWQADAIWLMGVWERSPRGAEVARQHTGLQEDYRRALPDYTDADVVGSPYAVHRYVADEHLGGREGLAAARARLAARGLKLLLDYVPNHVAVDHPWTLEHPEYFILGQPTERDAQPGEFFSAGEHVLAHGRDPYFPPWTDTAQLNAFSPVLLDATIATLNDIAAQCDGVRCDMAMLLITRIFEGTWGSRAGGLPQQEFWPQVIGAVKQATPEFLFMAEAYWDMEWELQQQGFDFCYDKRLYDRLLHEPTESIRLHLLADLSYQEKLVRFIENHDEPRAAAAFSGPQGRAAAVMIATLPGARLFHEGQFEGRRIKLPVQLGRRPAEAVDEATQAFYRALLTAVSDPVFSQGQWQLVERSGWADNPSWANFIAYTWTQGDSRRVIVLNHSRWGAQGRVHLPWTDLHGGQWQFTDLLTGTVILHDGSEVEALGLYIALPSYSAHLFALEQTA